MGNGVIPIPGNVASFTLADEFERGYIKSWNAFIQKELKWGFVGEIGYVGTRQIDQLGYRELNYPTVGGGASEQSFVPKVWTHRSDSLDRSGWRQQLRCHADESRATVYQWLQPECQLHLLKSYWLQPER
ncbi:MAG: hypothetical protein WKF84_28415 [Pyrinomonadaceae bacterium]